VSDEKLCRLVGHPQSVRRGTPAYSWVRWRWWSAPGHDRGGCRFHAPAQPPGRCHL